MSMSFYNLHALRTQEEDQDLQPPLKGQLPQVLHYAAIQNEQFVAQAPSDHRLGPLHPEAVSYNTAEWIKMLTLHIHGPKNQYHHQIQVVCTSSSPIRKQQTLSMPKQKVYLLVIPWYLNLAFSHNVTLVFHNEGARTLMA
nr:hypothetical protein Iba_chr14fCG0540 [Ipomoea batatas]GME09255.1 hypothetical protein Iba_scaffold8486CG0030 [Ipomoea batatas]